MTSHYSWTFAITEHFFIDGQEITTTRGIEANGDAGNMGLIADTLEYELAQRLRDADEYVSRPLDPSEDT